MIEEWTIGETDRQIAEELAHFIPDKLFDIHAHLYRLADTGLSPDSFPGRGPRELTVPIWKKRLGALVGEGRIAGGLFIPYPTISCNIDESNRFIVSQLDLAPEGRGLILAAPDYSEKQSAQFLSHPRIIGFKPYHCFSSENPTFESSLAGFIPQWVWEAADAESLVIMLHIVKDGALSDPETQREIREMCARHPGAKLILAHGARGFHAPNTIKGVRALAGLDNVWFDTSAVCEPGALAAILMEFGPRRLLWGSDFPISQMRGRCVTLGNSFSWVNPERIDIYPDAPACRTTLVGLESLRALKQAADITGLNAEDMRDISTTTRSACSVWTQRNQTQPASFTHTRRKGFPAEHSC